jgi:hypothetical protein
MLCDEETRKGAGTVLSLKGQNKPDIWQEMAARIELNLLLRTLFPWSMKCIPILLKKIFPTAQHMIYVSVKGG